MWIPYDLMEGLKPETAVATIELAKADRSVRDIVVGFFVRNPVTQTWEIDVMADAVNRVYRRDVGGMPAEIAFYGDASGKLNEIIYRVQGADPFHALAACRRDVDERLARWTLELGRGMALAGWRIADPSHGARWRCTPFRPSALELDLDAVERVDEDLKPLIRLYQRARNASDSSWRLLNAYAVLRPWRDGERPFDRSAQAQNVTFEMLVHSGAIGSRPELKDQPLAVFVDELKPLRDEILAGLEQSGVEAPDEAGRVRVARMASLADLAARQALLGEIARRKSEQLALAS